MSAICGIYRYDGRLVTPESGAAMLRELGSYQADTTGAWRGEQVFMGCHVQQITPVLSPEALPAHDAQAGLAIAADAIIDNRAELCDRLRSGHNSPGGRPDNLPDSRLILLAYQRWGQDCPKYMTGDFAFVIWDRPRQKLFCAVDPTGARAFYYARTGGLFAFATLLRPLFVLPEIVRKYSEAWIADFLALPSVMHQLDPELTPCENIYLLPAGHTLTVGPDVVKKQVYWQAEKQSELILGTDAEYEEAFRSVLSEAVRCRLRSTRPVGVMLSGGLDSTAVAGLAARELAASGRRLPAFSMVPTPGYRNWLPPGLQADETPYIEALKEHAGNIDITYCRSEGAHALSGAERLLSILEQPYKTTENSFWTDNIMAAARQQNVGVLLNGGAGNVTISWGDYPPYLLSLLQAGQWRRLCRESWARARRYTTPFKVLFKLWATLLPESLQILYNQLTDCDWQKNIRGLSPINPYFAHRINVRERFRQFSYDPLFINRLNSLEMRKQHLRPYFFSHLGVITTKNSLAYRMALRDPTMDRRVIDFCLSLPENQYVRAGRDRFLIRRAMTGIVPDLVRLNETVRGRQGADLAQRLQPVWPQIKEEIAQIGTLEEEREYLDIAAIRRELGRLGTLKDSDSGDAGLRMLLRSVVFCRFLREFE